MGPALWIESAIVCAALCWALVVILRRAPMAPVAWGITAACLLASLVVGAAWTTADAGRLASRAAVAREIPDLGLHDQGFVSSAACRACHPDHYSTWHASFHRTMTQPAAPGAVLGDFDGVALSSRGRAYGLERHGDEFWVDMVDPDWEHDLLDKGTYPNDVPDPPRAHKRVVMTTGSHHMQTYWVASDRDGRLFNVPFVWLNDDQRWAPREDVFLRPPGFPRQFGTWHSNCIECHSVAGEERRDEATGAYEPEAAELGIACEACHGPAATHVAAHRDPARRYRQRFGDEADPTIVNPRRLAARASAQVCGQCHGMNVFRGAEHRQGLRYRAGADLTETRMLLRTSDRAMLPDELPDWPRLERHLAAQPPTFLVERFWPDGMVRVSGREHNALVESACFLGGELSCLSCHTMHKGDPNDQLAAGMDGDAACLQCHGEYEKRLPEHTHHAPASQGSRCTNCHMPHTTYGLMKAIRSHLIDSPTVARSIETGRPNACNLCHLDRSLAWSAEHLARWYGQPDPIADADRADVSAALSWLLSGDAHQRALVAWHMGWEPARQASGRQWMGPYLAHLLADPYACVRYIAARSLRTLAGFGDLEYDFTAPQEELLAARRRAVDRWAELLGGRAPDRTGPEVLIDATGSLMREPVSALASRRDDRPVDLRE